MFDALSRRSTRRIVGKQAAGGDTLAGVNVLVTGGGGFLGSHLVERLRGGGPRPVRRAPRATTTSPARTTPRGCSPTRGRSVVFHLAAEVGGIGANRANPGRFWYANLVMGMHVIEQCRLRAASRKLVVAGTVCAYPKFTPVPFREDELWNGYPEETNAPYGVAKKRCSSARRPTASSTGSTRSSCSRRTSTGRATTSTRRTSHVIPDLIRKMLERRPASEVVLWGDGSPTREFLYVDDAAEALLLAAERYDGAEPVNLGTGVEISIRDLADLVARADRLRRASSSGTRRSPTASRAASSTRRARSELFGFEAQTTLRDGPRADDRLVPRVEGRACAGLSRARRAAPRGSRRSSPSVAASRCQLVSLTLLARAATGRTRPATSPPAPRS